MNLFSGKKILGFFAVLAVLTSATLTWACGQNVSRWRSPLVNTRVEARFDRNHNGWIGPWEQARLNYRRVNSSREFYCDYNRNGYIDRAAERACL